MSIALFVMFHTMVSSYAQTTEQLKMYEESKRANKGNENSLNMGSDAFDGGDADDAPKARMRDKSDDEYSYADDYRVKKLTYAQKDSIDRENEKKRILRDKHKVFGREIFDRKNINFAPSYNIPTPDNYVLGAGDQVFIDIWGDTQKSHELTISPDGNVMIPKVGMVSLGGLTVEKAQALLEKRLTENIESIGSGSSNVKISLGRMRSIKVNIIGEANTPGTYTLPSLATLFNALYAAGGVTDIGSLRKIKLYRQGKEIAKLDIYDYLLNGNDKVNVRLAENDLIVVEPYENLVSVTGKVRRERKYETKGDETLAELLVLAGGMTGDAYVENLNVNRKTGRQYELFTVPQSDFNKFKLQDRDSIVVGEVVDKFANKVNISGAVWRPGEYALSENMATISDLINMVEGLREDAYQGRVQIIRVLPDRTKEVIPINIEKILSKEMPDVMLQKDDWVSVLSIDGLRQKRMVSLKGELNKPQDNMEFYDNMTIEDAIIIGGGLTDAASKARLEVVRRIRKPNSTEVTERKAEVFSFIIPESLTLSERASNFKLMPFDEVYVRRSPGYSEQAAVVVVGQVVFPGEYALLTANDRISTLINKAGGLSPTAYVKGANLKRLVSKSDMVRINAVNKMISSNTKMQSNDTMQIDIKDMVSQYPVGIDLVAALDNPGSDADIVLQEGDELIIPEYNNVVKISGAVYYPNAVAYNPKMKFKDYIDMAGGYKTTARRKPFIVYMNGMIAAVNSSKGLIVEPGCEIIVPSKIKTGTPASLAEIISVSSSAVSMMALVANLFNK